MAAAARIAKEWYASTTPLLPVLHTVGQCAEELPRCLTCQLLIAACAQAMSSKESLVAHLQQRIDELTVSNRQAAADHEAHMFKLISSVHQMQESCQAQVMKQAACNCAFCMPCL
jgi:hypothetical protein